MNTTLLVLVVISSTYITDARLWSSAESGAGEKQTKGGTQQPSTTTSAGQSANGQSDCGCKGAPPPETLAIVNGLKITLKDVDDRVADQIKELQQEVVEARKNKLQEQINSKLFGHEAKRREITVAQLMNEEVAAKIKEPTESEAQLFYNENKATIPVSFEVARLPIINHLRNQRKAEETERFADRLRSASQVKVMVENPAPPKSLADRAQVLATVHNEPITSGEIEDILRPVVIGTQDKIYYLRKKELILRLNSLLLQQEASKKGMTPQELLNAEVASRSKKLTEDDARSFYEKNKKRFNGDFDSSREKIFKEMQERERKTAEAAVYDQLWRAGSVKVFLTETDEVVNNILIDNRPSKGNPAAPVTIVEFSDFQCPACAEVQKLLKVLMNEYGNKIRVVALNFPLQMHEHAFKAAEAAEAAFEQGKYWEYAEILYNNQKALDADKLKQYAGQLFLDRAKFDAALDSGKFSARVQRDVEDGLKLGIHLTPTIYVNGRRVRVEGYDSLKSAIDAALRDTGK